MDRREFERLGKVVDGTAPFCGAIFATAARTLSRPKCLTRRQISSSRSVVAEIRVIVRSACRIHPRIPQIRPLPSRLVFGQIADALPSYLRGELYQTLSASPIRLRRAGHLCVTKFQCSRHDYRDRRRGRFLAFATSERVALSRTTGISAARFDRVNASSACRTMASMRRDDMSRVRLTARLLIRRH